MRCASFEEIEAGDEWTLRKSGKEREAAVSHDFTGNPLEHLLRTVL
jgi:hypothetical protein